MSWRFSSSYTPRDLSSSRDTSTSNKYNGVSSLASKFNSSSSSTTDRPSRWSKANDTSRSYTSSSDHSPIWAKTSITDNPSSVVQRLKDRYNATDNQKTDKYSDIRSAKRAETKDLSSSLSSSLSSRPYGRTTTNLDSSLSSSQKNYENESKKEPVKDSYSYSKSYGDRKVTSNIKSDNDKDSGSVYSRFRKRPEKSPEPEKVTSYDYRTRRPDYSPSANYVPLESRTKLYTSSSLGSSPATSRFLASRKYGSDHSPTTPTTPTTPTSLNTFSFRDKYEKQPSLVENTTKTEKPEKDKNHEEDDTITIVTRGTSPTEPSSSVYLRTRRADLSKGIEKKVPKPKTKPEVIDKEIQTEKAEENSSKYNFGDTNARIKPWSSYLDKYSGGTTSYSPVSRYSSRTNYGVDGRREPSIVISHARSDNYSLTGSRLDSNNYKRSVSNEEALTQNEIQEHQKVPEKQPEGPLTSKPPTSTPKIDNKPKAVSPAKDPDKKTIRKSSSKSGASLEVDTSSASEAQKSKSTSPLQFKMSPEPEAIKEAVKNHPETNGVEVSYTFQIKSPTPKLVMNNNDKSLVETSSASESSSEEETSSGSESEEEEDEKEAPTTTSATSSIKRSITNFLQNIPNIITRKPGSSTESMANRSKPNLYQKLSAQAGSAQKIKIQRIESGERPWWLQSNEQIPEGVTRILSNRSIGKQDQGNDDGRRHVIPRQYSTEEWWLKDEDDNQLTKTNNQSRSSIKNLPPKVPSNSHTNTLLASPYLINRQFSRDKDWLKSSTDDIAKETQNVIDDSFSIMKHCNGDKTWWLDGNDNIMEPKEEIAKLHIPIQRNEDGTWWMNDEPSTKGVNTNVITNGNYDSSIFIADGFSVSNNVNSSGKEAESIKEAEYDHVCGKWLSDGVTIAQNSFQINDNHLKNSINETIQPERNNLQDEDGEEEIDVTPALRRRREQHHGSKSPDIYHQEEYQMKFNQNRENNIEPTNDGKKYLEDFPIECSVKDITQKLVNQNGLGSPLEEKSNNLLETGDMSGMISKAKAGLMKSKTKFDVRKSSSREMSPKVAELGKSEIDLYWKELIDSMNRPLKLCDLDFTDLNTDDEDGLLGYSRTNGEVPPPPPLLVLMPMPNGIDSNVPMPPSSMILPISRNSRAPVPPPMNQIVKNKKTVKLFWKEVKDDPIIQLKTPGVTLIWDELQRVTVDTQKLEHLFESRAKDLISKKQQEQNKSKEIIVLDHKRSNAINIGMTKLPPPRAIKTAILKMDSTVVNKEGIEKLLTMLPTDEERMRIQDAQNANPELPLGSAEQFLLTLASISELEARLKLWAFKLDFENSEREICEPLMDLKQGIEILRVNKTFHGILSTLLSIGNFLNGYDVKGFQIDYLSKVPEVKDTVYKHSLLHHLCIIVMEKFPDSTDLYSEIGAVTRASKVDFDELSANIKKVEDECKLSWNYLKIIAKHEGHTTMKMKMSDFLADCAERIIVLGTVHRRVISRFQKFILWLGIPINRISTTRPNEIFKIISEFALEYRTTRERVLQQLKKINHREKSRTRGYQMNDNHDSSVKKMNSKEAKDDAKLRQLLGNETTHSENMHRTSTWRRNRKDTRDLSEQTNHNDDEIIETLIKTANQIPSSRTSMKERRRSRIERKY